MKKIILVIFFLCVSLTPTIAQEQHGDSQTAITKTVEASVGEEFTIILESNHTTGYNWQLVRPPDKGIAKFVRTEYRVPEIKAIGAGGKEVWTFKAVENGNTTIHMEYIRPWEKDTPPARVATFEVIVIPAR